MAPPLKKCPQCQDRTPVVTAGGFGGAAVIQLCGVCGYEYPQKDKG